MNESLEEIKALFDIIEVDEIIGHYDDINNRKKNLIINDEGKEVKMFKKCGVKLKVKPKHPAKKKILNNAGARDMFRYMIKNKQPFDFIFSDGYEYITFIDAQNKIIKIELILDDYYPYGQMCKIVKSYINDNIDYGITYEYDKELMLKDINVKIRNKEFFIYDTHECA